MLIVIALSASISRDDGPLPSQRPGGASPSGTSEPRESRTAPRPEETAEAQPPLPVTSDPDEYAEAVAELVLGMDPAEHSPRWHRRVLLEALDQEVLDEDFDRLSAVTLSWVPDDVIWRRQADLEQSTSFRSSSVVEPDRAVFADGAPDGHEVRTVSGVQEVGYLAEDGRRASYTQGRSLSVWMFCPPGGSCGLVSIPREVLR